MVGFILQSGNREQGESAYGRRLQSRTAMRRGSRKKVWERNSIVATKVSQPPRLCVDLLQKSHFRDEIRYSSRNNRQTPASHGLQIKRSDGA